ncbi:MAG: transporter ATP-binding protein [Frankiales bacterium]|nr:transporter ATP-binding protein [Frankiales bacterium]
MPGPAIRTEKLTKRYADVVALDRLDLEVQRGEVFGFLGPNGAGKSTAIRLLLGLIRPTSGDATLMGIPVADVRRAHRHLGYVPGDVTLWPQLTGAEILTLLGNLSGGVDQAYRQELIDRFELDVHKRARSYSKGNRQKVALVAAFMTRPDVLLLDEPTSGLDPLKMQEFQAVVREAAGNGQTVLLSSHLLDEVQDVCSQVGILRHGRLVEVATLEELRRTGATVYDVQVAGAAPTLTGVPGVLSVVPRPGGFRVTAQGPPTALLAELARHPVTSLRSRDPDLEEVFLSFYGPAERQ